MADIIPVCLATDCFSDFCQIYLNVKRIEKVEFQAIIRQLGKTPEQEVRIRRHPTCCGGLHTPAKTSVHQKSGSSSEPPVFLSFLKLNQPD